MSEAFSRRRVLAGGLVLALGALGARPGLPAAKATVAVHKSPT